MGRTTRILCEDIQFGESPRWHQTRLWFSDFFAHEVKSISPAGDLRTEVALDDQPSGLGWMPDGSLLIVSMIKRQLLRRSPDGKLTLHADLSRIADFHCNDMVVDATGGAYVGDFGFDLPGEMARRGAESVLADHPTAKLIYVSADGAARVVVPDMHFPNGSVITPDGKTLIVAETLAEGLTAFDIAADGSLTGRRLWARLSPPIPQGSAELFARPIHSAFHRLPDGIAQNAAGQIWIANALAPECVLFAPGGKVLDTIDTGLPCFACMLGGDDGRTLFMFTAAESKDAKGIATVKGKLLTATVDTPHAGRP
jgi:sugar lactone lactonase YvrE